MVLETNVTKMLGIKHPIVGAPMGPFYTTELTVAVSEAGGLGVLSHTNLFGKSSTEEMKKNMEYVIEHTDKPFGFNIRTARMQMDALKLCREIPKFIMSKPKLREQIRTCSVVYELFLSFRGRFQGRVLEVFTCFFE